MDTTALFVLTIIVSTLVGLVLIVLAVPLLSIWLERYWDWADRMTRR